MDENEVKSHMKAAIGQDSHRFEETPGKPLILGGVVFPGEVGLLANSDGDVVLHAITNAVSGITGRNILGRVADEMCQSGITDSAEYLRGRKRLLNCWGWSPRLSALPPPPARD